MYYNIKNILKRANNNTLKEENIIPFEQNVGDD